MIATIAAIAVAPTIAAIIWKPLLRSLRLFRLRLLRSLRSYGNQALVYGSGYRDENMKLTVRLFHTFTNCSFSKTMKLELQNRK